MTLDFPYHTVADLAREDGLSPAAVRSKLRRCGLKAIRSADRTPLERAELMPDREAVGYLKDALQLAYDALEIGERWPGMTSAESRIMFALHRAYVSGGYKSRYSLRSVAQVDPLREVPSDRTLDAHITHIRRKLEKSREWRIVTLPLDGYKLVRAD